VGSKVPRRRRHGKSNEPYETIRIFAVLLQVLTALIVALNGCGLT
jgi:hypothetical protein